MEAEHVHWLAIFNTSTDRPNRNWDDTLIENVEKFRAEVMMQLYKSENFLWMSKKSAIVVFICSTLVSEWVEQGLKVVYHEK